MNYEMSLPNSKEKLPVAFNVQISRDHDRDTLSLIIWIKRNMNMTGREIIVYAVKLMYELIKLKKSHPEGRVVYVPDSKLSKVTQILNN
jgi:hypothetical protein